MNRVELRVREIAGVADPRPFAREATQGMRGRVMITSFDRRPRGQQ